MFKWLPVKDTSDELRTSMVIIEWLPAKDTSDELRTSMVIIEAVSFLLLSMWVKAWLIELVKQALITSVGELGGLTFLGGYVVLQNMIISVGQYPSFYYQHVPRELKGNGSLDMNMVIISPPPVGLVAEQSTSKRNSDGTADLFSLLYHSDVKEDRSVVPPSRPINFLQSC
ncbi:unnamed protein product [Ilex paraguariensis]|uniref:Uncharacterized protein n=1 Tax=Ilex paraguariensis TaxID=185542 RepID=A0ABC8UWU9_9AQUA